MEVLVHIKKMTGKSDYILPEQEAGAKKDIEHIVAASDENDARKLFLIARNRLLDVNHWHEFSGPLSATFQLTDQNGNEVYRTAEVGDYFKIEIPAPGPAEGNGFDWARIESIEDKSDSNGSKELMGILVRPAPDPKDNSDNVAHFFKSDSTSSFIVYRDGKKVTAVIFGRNEMPNTETSNVIDKVRNTIVGLTAILGFSNLQWKNLAKGLLSNSKAA
jgi:hypothetical protein